ncbi:C4-dicarboxylate ABC transporter substrate-binding protein [Desulfomarina profundi]|uniref:C4-dicarboxylate ABC transporter substrate-binding protein n=2 Tax=Desulfomarina profundi TaxID=2772557 RepID=A0A8D5JPR7_9BACT|nr:C4-dicarboxylate ABC transporter substrate-binding protein [Desulfomarina profundi]
MGIVTGSTKGTYYQFGLNLASLLERNDISLDVSASNGSVENIYAVYKRPNTQLGIVQADVLAFVSRVQTDPVLKKIAQKIKMVFPLYNEEIHLVGQNTLQSFSDLQGKRVAIGKEGSGTYLTAQLLFEISGIRPSEKITIGTNDALQALKEGTVDAMFYVAGYPVKLLSSEITAEDNLSLLSILDKEIINFYPQTTIPAETYSWQQEDVPTVAVKAVLISFNFRYANCQNVGRAGQLIYENMDWLKQHGHPKWLAVDLNYPLKGWQQYDCVKKRLVHSSFVPNTTDEVNPVLQAIKGVLQE